MGAFDTEICSTHETTRLVGHFDHKGLLDLHNEIFLPYCFIANEKVPFVGNEDPLWSNCPTSYLVVYSLLHTYMGLLAKLLKC